MSRKTPLHDRHAELGARFTDFGGWDMPVTFDSIRTEHAAVRESVGIFDVSHMGEIRVSGADSRELCQRMTTNDVETLEPGRAQYSTVTNDEGHILDDIMVFQVADEEYLFVPNAGTDGWMTDRWTAHRDDWSLSATVDNETESWGMLAVQGLDSVDLVRDAIGSDPDELARNEITEVTIAGADCLLSRTGYTGEVGFEVLAPWDETPAVDDTLPGQRCGLGARDTLRLEMGYLLAGHEFDAEDNPRTPIEAGIGFVVDVDATPHFVGRDAVARQLEAGPEERLVGLVLEQRGVPREGYEITDGTGAAVGIVTSGTMSPTLGDPIALGYVDAARAEDGATVAVRIRGDEKKARIVTPPFLEVTR